MVSAMNLGEEQHVDQAFTSRRPQALVLRRKFNHSGTRKTAQWCTTIWDTSRMSLEQLLPVVVDGPARSSALLD